MKIDRSQRKRTSTARHLLLGVRAQRGGLLCLIVLMVGCGANPSGFQFANVTGHVTLGGKPVPSAYVQFWPTTKGPSSYAYTDGEGKYSLEANSAKGALIQTHEVRVTLGIPTSEVQLDSTLPGEEQPVSGPPPVDYIFDSPVSVNAGTNVIDFNLNDAQKRSG